MRCMLLYVSVIQPLLQAAKDQKRLLFVCLLFVLTTSLPSLLLVVFLLFAFIDFYFTSV